VKNVEKPYGESFSIAELESAIILHRPHVLYLVNGESSMGVLQNVNGIGKICRK